MASTKEGLSAGEIRLRSLYMRLYGSYRTVDEDWYPARFCGPEVEFLLMRGHVEAHGGGYRLTPEGVVWWSETVLAGSNHTFINRIDEYRANVRIGQMVNQMKQTVQATFKLLSDKQKDALVGIAGGGAVSDFHHKTVQSLLDQGFFRQDEYGDVTGLAPEGEEIALALTRQVGKAGPHPRPLSQGRGEASPAVTKAHPWSYEGQNPGAAPRAEAKEDPITSPSPEAERGKKQGGEDVAAAVSNREWMVRGAGAQKPASAAEANGHDCEGCSYRQAVELMAKKFPELGELVAVLEKADKRLGTG